MSEINHSENHNNTSEERQRQEESDSEEDLTEEHGNHLLIPFNDLSTTEQQTDSTTQLPTSIITTTTTSLNPVHSSSDATRTRSKSNADLVTSLLPRSQRVWELDRHAPECRRCHRRFNFLVRRHHCR